MLIAASIAAAVMLNRSADRETQLHPASSEPPQRAAPPVAPERARPAAR